MNITRQRAFAIVAAESAPTSAPAPKHAEMIPNVRGPASSVFFASSGSRMLKLKQNDEKTTIIESDHEHGSIAARVDESFARAAPEGRAAAVEQRVELATRIASNPASTATKLTVLIAKHQPAPHAAMRTPGERGAEDARAC